MELLRTFAVLVTSVTISTASEDISSCPGLTPQFIAETIQKAKTWKVRDFGDNIWKEAEEINDGVLPREATLRYFDTGRYNPHNESEEVPEYFDARQNWPNCNSIKQIRNQGPCQSSWAFAAVEAMSDRICIHSNQTKQVYVSAENLLACCDRCSPGCHKEGDVDLAWEYWSSTGIVTGGLYNSSQGCQDYSINPDSHNAVTPKCSNTCYDTSLDYETSKTYGQIPNKFSNEKQIMLEIYKNGPVEATYTVYCDFELYGSGIYQSTNDIIDGYRAIKIIGWGVENDTPYWLIANSLGDQWGEENGYFKILRGSNHCRIEEFAISSLPIL